MLVLIDTNRVNQQFYQVAKGTANIQNVLPFSLSCYDKASYVIQIVKLTCLYNAHTCTWLLTRYKFIALYQLLVSFSE